MKNHPGIQKLNGGLERTLTNKTWREKEKHASVMLSKLELKVFAYRNGTVRTTKKDAHTFISRKSKTNSFSFIIKMV